MVIDREREGKLARTVRLAGKEKAWRTSQGMKWEAGTNSARNDQLEKRF